VDESDKERLRPAYREHLKLVKRERSSYYRRRRQSILFPKKYLSIIIDGADQAKFWLPYGKEKTHADQAAWKVRTHLMGAIAHGHGTYCYLYDDNCEQGNNVTIDTLHRVLVHLIKKNGSLPPKLYLQLDNTSKQCKGQWLFYYLAALVDHGVFEKIVTSFLPVGHTHEDIDQMFSRVATRFRTRNAFDMEQMVNVVRSSYTYTLTGEHPQTEYVQSVVNFKGFVKKHIISQTQLEGISQYYQFRFQRRHGTDGRVVVQGRYWPGGRDMWTGVGIEKKIANATEMFKTGHCPRLVVVDFPPPIRHAPLDAKMIKKVKAGIDKLAIHQGISAASVASLVVIVDRLGEPAAVHLPTRWDQEDVDLLCMDDAALQTARLSFLPGAAQVDGSEENPEPKIKAVVGSFYLVKPQKGSKVEYDVAEVKKLEQKQEVDGKWYLTPHTPLEY
jgi:hypothetical protein